MKYKIFKIKEGKLKQWKDWCDFLIKNKTDVLETMEEEKVTRESSVLYGNTLFYFMVGECLPAKDRKINTLHRKK
jgi:hypothetical protein